MHGACSSMITQATRAYAIQKYNNHDDIIAFIYFKLKIN